MVLKSKAIFKCCWMAFNYALFTDCLGCAVTLCIQ